jgi:zinc protease
MRFACRAALLGAGLALAVPAALPAPAQAQARDAAGVFNPETFTLPNGLQVVVVTNRRAPVVLHMVWYKVGSADEPAGKSGIAHFLEHLMFKGTRTLQPGQFSKIVASNGGQENALTSYDYTAYYQNVAKDRLETVMKIEADRMANLVLPDHEVARERDVILEERRQRTENSPRAILWEQAMNALYLHHPYKIPIIGWEHEMRGLTRADALDFYKRHYGPNNAVLIVAGDVTAAEVKPLAEKYYGAIAAVPLQPRLRVQEPPQRAPRRVVYKDARVNEPSWSRLYQAPSYASAKDKKQPYALQVLSEILGGGSTSRLYVELSIKRRITTGAGAGYSPNALDGTAFYFYGSPVPGTPIEKVEEAMIEELQKLLKDGVTEEEVRRAKQRLIDRAEFARDSLRNAAYAFGTALATGSTVEDVEAWPRRIAEITVADVNAAARAALRDEASVTAVLIGTGRQSGERPDDGAPTGAIDGTIEEE